MKKIKLVALVKTHRSRKTLWVGTINELAKAFGYTLECGWSYNHKIKTADEITTIKSLVSNLTKSVRETQGCCWDPDYYDEANDMITDEVRDAYMAQQETYKGSYTKSLD